MFNARVLAAVSLLSVAGAAYADPPPPRDAKSPAARTESAKSPPARAASPTGGGRGKAADIVTQPARDIGVSRREIPPPLVKATKAPYSLDGLRNCRQLVAAVEELNQVLGPDFQQDSKYRENRAAKLAEAGGKTVVNSLIPFRSLVREVTGAAPADRRLNAAIDAGFARRGFLRGVHATRRCRPQL